jgi:hypothetical protein
MRVLTEERDKGKGREGNYREEHVERRDDDCVAQSKCGVWGPRGRAEDVGYLTRGAVSEWANAGGNKLPKREGGSGGSETDEGPLTNRKRGVWGHVVEWRMWVA